MNFKTQALLASILATSGAADLLGPAQTKYVRKDVKPKPEFEFTPEETAEMDRLQLDRSSRGRRAFKAYKKQLVARYTNGK